MAGPIRQRLRDRFPVISHVIDAGRRAGEVAKAVAVGTTQPRPANQSPEAIIGAPFLALVRKAIAGAVAGAIAWLVAKTGINLGFVSGEITELIVGAVVGFFLVWRTPNAPKEPPA